MGKNLSSTARRSICALALVVGVAGAIALPAVASASHGKRASQHRTHVSTVVRVADGTAARGGATGTKVESGAVVLGRIPGTKAEIGTVVLGPVKYVRRKDGTIRQVR